MRDDLQWICIHTDGASQGNPGPSSWAAVLQWKLKTKEISGFVKYGTNNQMEMMAVIEALKAIKKAGEKIVIFTDSQYVYYGITEWIHGWKKNGWKNRNKKEVANKPLWVQLDQLREGHEIIWNWVPGHSGNKGNERADVLCKEAISRGM